MSGFGSCQGAPPRVCPCNWPIIALRTQGTFWAKWQSLIVICSVVHDPRTEMWRHLRKRRSTDGRRTLVTRYLQVHFLSGWTDLSRYRCLSPTLAVNWVACDRIWVHGASVWVRRWLHPCRHLSVNSEQLPFLQEGKWYAPFADLRFVSPV